MYMGDQSSPAPCLSSSWKKVVLPCVFNGGSSAERQHLDTISIFSLLTCVLFTCLVGKFEKSPGVLPVKGLSAKEGHWSPFGRGEREYVLCWKWVAFRRTIIYTAMLNNGSLSDTQSPIFEISSHPCSFNADSYWPPIESSCPWTSSDAKRE